MFFLSVVMGGMMVSCTKKQETKTAEDYIQEAAVTTQGKHCSYTVGCDCPGFQPKTNGTVADQSICKKCGHHKKYHK